MFDGFLGSVTDEDIVTRGVGIEAVLFRTIEVGIAVGLSAKEGPAGSVSRAPLSEKLRMYCLCFHACCAYVPVTVLREDLDVMEIVLVE